MAKVSWMYKNFCNSASSITDTFGTSDTTYGTANLIDNNLHTTWNLDRSDLTNQPYASVVFDFGSSVSVDSLIVVHNSDSGTMYFLASDTTSFEFFTESPFVIGDTPYVLSDTPLNYGNALSGMYGLPILGSTGTSMHFISAPVSYRYWGLFIGGTHFDEAIKVNEVFVGKRDNFSVNPEYSFKKEMDSSTITTTSEKGQKRVYHKYTRNNWEFDYSSIDDAVYGTMLKIRKYCNGSYKPFWICFDIDDKPQETFMVRFGKNGFTHSEVNYGNHNVNIRLEQEL